MLRVAILCGLCVLSGCGASKHRVTYKVTGPPGWLTPDGVSASAQVTIANPGGGTETHDASLPYSTQLRLPKGASVYLSAQIKDGDAVSCEIDVDGVVVKQAHSHGQFSVATCSGTVGIVRSGKISGHLQLH